MAVYTSVVKWFDAKKGYGFVVHPEGGQDVFVHYTQIVSDKRFKTLRTGEEVQYELMDGPKGLHAHNVATTGKVIRVEEDGSDSGHGTAGDGSISSGTEAAAVHSDGLPRTIREVI